MDPVRSSIVDGVVATAVLTVLLLVADFFPSGMNLFVFATFTGLCVVGGPPYCALGSLSAVALTYFWFLALYVLAWPLLFAGFTWGLPGESGFAHRAIYGLILWMGNVAVVVYGVTLVELSFAENLPLLGTTLVAYLVYGLVLGSVYDRLAAHRTLLSSESTSA